MWGARSLERANRWLDRIRPLTETTTGHGRVPDRARQDIEDFVAAALGEATEVLEKGKSQLEDAYIRRGQSKTQAKKLAGTFVEDWLEPRAFMRGMLAVRHLDVHLEGRYSGRMIQINATSPMEAKIWWTHPAIPPDQHDRLRPGSQLKDDELAAFNQYMKDTNLLDVLTETIAEMGQFQQALAATLR